jgi:hypothetical protein
VVNSQFSKPKIRGEIAITTYMDSGFTIDISDQSNMPMMTTDFMSNEVRYETRKTLCAEMNLGLSIYGGMDLVGFALV